MKLAWFSCDAMQGESAGLYRIVGHDPDVVISHGDTPYTAGSVTAFGFTTAGFTTATTVATAKDKFNQWWSKPAVVALRNCGARLFWQLDDHEWGGDNWDHTIAQANDKAPIGAVTQADVNNHWWVCVQAAGEVMPGLGIDNPAFGVNVAGDRPSECTSGGENPPASQYPIRYWYEDYSMAGVLGGSDIRVIYTDSMSYRSPTAAAESGAKRFLGVTQEAWLIATIAAAASFQHVIVASSKKLWKTLGGLDNGDTFGSYTTERDRVLAAVKATGVQVLWISGDRHQPHVMQARESAGAAFNAFNICACPISVDLNNAGRTVAETGVSVEWIGGAHCYGLLTIDARGIVADVRNARTGSVMWTAAFAPKSGVPVYAPAVDAVEARRLTVAI